MATTVQLPNGTELDFPEGMSQDAMRDAIYKNFPESAPQQGLMDKARGMVGSIASDGADPMTGIDPTGQSAPEAASPSTGSVMDNLPDTPHATPARYDATQVGFAQAGANRMQHDKETQDMRAAGELHSEAHSLGPDPDFATREQFTKSPFFSHPAVRAAVKGYEGFKLGYDGLNEKILTTLGADEMADVARGSAAETRRQQMSIGENSDKIKNTFEGAVTSIAQQLPALMGGAVTGSEPLVLGAMWAQSFGQEYSEGRASGQSDADATLRASLYGTFEVLGEKFGLHEQLQGIKGALRGAPTQEVLAHFAKALVREVPGEELTTLGEFLTDKIPGGIGLHNEAGMAQYLQQAADTLTQTMMQGALMMGGGAALSKGVSMAQQALPATRQIANAINGTALNPLPGTQPAESGQVAAADAARQAALDKGASMFGPDSAFGRAANPELRREPQLADIGRAPTMDAALAAFTEVTAPPTIVGNDYTSSTDVTTLEREAGMVPDVTATKMDPLPAPLPAPALTNPDSTQTALSAQTSLQTPVAAPSVSVGLDQARAAQAASDAAATAQTANAPAGNDQAALPAHTVPAVRPVENPALAAPAETRTGTPQSVPNGETQARADSSLSAPAENSNDTPTEKPAQTKRESDLAALEKATSKQLRVVATTEKRLYMRHAAADILSTRDAVNRQKRSDVAKKVYAKSKRIDPDTDTMAQAIAKMGGIQTDSAASRLRLRPEELSARGHGIARLFTSNGKTMDEMGAALAELGYVQRDDNGKHDHTDFEDKLGDVVNGAEVLTPQAMMTRAQAEHEAAQEEVGTESPEDYDAIERYLDEMPDDMQRAIDAAFDAPFHGETLSDEEIDRRFGYDSQAESRDFPENGAAETARAADQGNQAPQQKTEQVGDDYALQGETRAEGDARLKAQVEALDKRLAETQRQLDAEKKARIDKEIAQRQDASAENFQLGQSADDSLSGQKDIFSGDDDDKNVLFSKSKKDDARDLIITHNITAENLRHADRMGGMAVPSFGIVKKDRALEGFGDITLIGSRHMADPKGYANTKVFGADIYSPRYPEISYKVDNAALKKINQFLAPFRKEGERDFYGSDVDRIDDLTSNKTFKAYAADHLGIDYVDITWPQLKEQAAALLRKAGAVERIFQGYTNSGNRRYTPYTLENVVKILKKEIRGGEGFNYGVGSVRAKYTPQFRSIDQIKKEKGRLVDKEVFDKEVFDKIKQEIDDEFFEVANQLAPFHAASDRFGFADTVSMMMGDAATMGIPRAMRENGFADVSEDAMLAVRDFLEKLRHLPTQYFEAKILRDVSLSEFSGAVIPKDTPQDVRDILQRHGVPFKEYDDSAPENRARAVDAFSQELDQKNNDILFSQTNRRGGMSVDAVRTALTTLRAKWEGFHDIRIVQSLADLPQRFSGAGFDAQTEGFYDPATQTVHLIADNIASPERAAWVAIHEVAGHAGLRMLGDSAITQAVNLAGKNRFVRDLAKAIAQDRGNESNTIEEALAELQAAIETDNFQAIEDRYGVAIPASAKNGIAGVIARIVAAIRRFVASLTGRKPEDISDADVRGILSAARDMVEVGGWRGVLHNGREVLQSDKAPTLYSALARAVPAMDKIAGKDGTVGTEQARLWLEARQKEGKFKREELEWSGLKDWLQAIGGRVSVGSIEMYLKNNGVQVQEVMKGTPPGKPRWDGNKLYSEDGKLIGEMNGDGQTYTFVRPDGSVHDTGHGAMSDAVDDVENMHGMTVDPRDDAKYPSYTLPGGQNYRELLLTLPQKDIAMPTGEVVEDGKDAEYPFAIMVNGREENRSRSREFADDILREEIERAQRKSQKANGFTSAHWNEPNIVAHIRFNDRTDADGKRVLFIEELQSDWGQSNRKVLDQIAKPESVRELANNIFGREMASMMPLNEMDGGVIAAIHHDQVSRAVIARLPVDVVNDLAAAKFSPNDLLRNPDMVISRLPSDHRGTVADGLLGALRSVGADLRAKLFLARDTGRDGNLLPALKASDLNAREVVGLLSPQRIYHEGLPRSAGNGNVAGARAEQAGSLGDLAGRSSELNTAVRAADGGDGLGAGATAKSGRSGAAGANAESNGTSLASLVDWHNRIVRQSGHSSQAGYKHGPFVDKTEAFLQLGIKRMIRYAAENGYDKIAFVNGDQSAERYDLSKQVDSIQWYENDGKYNIGAMKDGREQIGKNGLSIDEVADLVGKDVAAKIEESAKTEVSGELSGVDLKVGGEGMKAFYDKIVPQVANDVLKKLGGDKVDTVTIDTTVARDKMNDSIAAGDVERYQLLLDQAIRNGNESRAQIAREELADAQRRVARGRKRATLAQPGFTITPELRAKALNGLPLFSTAPAFAANPNSIAATWPTPAMSKMDDVIRTLQDKQVDTKRVVDAIKTAGNAIGTKWDPYLQEELFHGRSAKAVKDFLDAELRPLLQDMQLRRVDMADFEDYLQARHAEERNDQIARINPQMPDGGSGIDTQDARTYLAGLPADKRRAYQALAQRVYAITRNTRELLVRAGLEERSTIKAWEGAYKYYVPLMREEGAGGAGTGQGFSVRGPASKRAMGSKRNVLDILANVAMQRERAIVRAEKNRVATALYGLSLKAPNPDFWVPVNPEKAASTVLAELIRIGLNPADAQSILAEPTQRIIDPTTGLVTQRVNPLLRGAENVIAVRVGGQDRFLFFNEDDERAKRMVAALKNLDADQLGRVLQLSAKVTRYFAAVNTQYNPIFGVVNLMRDAQDAMLNLASTPLAGKQKDIAMNTVSALRGIYIDLRDHRSGITPNSAWANLFEEFQNAGGQTGYKNIFSNSAERADMLKKELKRMSEGKIKTAGRAVFDWLSDYNEAMENATRLAAYKVAKDGGMPIEEAASLAKNLTVNFNRKGQIATQAGAMYAFFNAAVQGTTRMGKTLAGPAGKKIIVGGLILGAMQALMMAAAGFDDEEPPEFVKAKNVIIPLGNGKYLTVPMPLGYAVIPTIGRLTTEFSLRGFKKPAKFIAALFDAFADTFNPIGNAGMSVQTLAPTAIDPLVALSENRDWTGKPIAKKDMNALQATPGHTRAKDTASAISKTLAVWINAASGGSKYAPGLVSPTPDQLDYLIGQVTGGVGREALKSQQTVSSLFSGEDLPPHKMPLVGRFYGDTKGQSATASKFYDNLKELNEHDLEIKGRRKDHGDVTGYLRDHPDAHLAPAADAAEREIAELRQHKRDLLAKDASKDRIKLVEQQITGRMTKFNERVEASRKRAKEAQQLEQN